MTFLRRCTSLIACLALLACSGCGPSDPKSRIDDALRTLQSDAGGSRKATACSEFQAALQEYPVDAADRPLVIDRAVPLLVMALRDPTSRPQAEEALVDIGVPSYERLFDALLEGDPATQHGAEMCLIRMSLTVVPVLIPALLGDDPAAQDRAARILGRVGKSVTPTLRMYYTQVLEPFTPQADSTEAADLSAHGKTAILAFARIFGAIGDETSMLALLDGCEALHRRYPDVATAHLRILEALGPEALNRLSSAQRLTYDRLRLTLGSP
jgi:HEAT repeat protein